MKDLLNWEVIGTYFHRAMVPGGWLVRSDEPAACVNPGGEVDYDMDYRTSMTFLPDPGHRWGNEDKEPDELVVLPVADSPGPHLFVITSPSIPNLLCQSEKSKISKRREITLRSVGQAVHEVYPGSKVIATDCSVKFNRVAVTESKENGETTGSTPENEAEKS